MLDIKFIRSNPEFVQEGLNKRFKNMTDIMRFLSMNLYLKSKSVCQVE